MAEGLTPKERSLRARAAAFALHAQHDPRETTRAARRAFLQRFDDEVDPDRKLAPDERRRRAESARRSYFQRLALKSARARRRRSKSRRPDDHTEEVAS